MRFFTIEVESRSLGHSRSVGQVEHSRRDLEIGGTACVHSEPDPRSRPQLVRDAGGGLFAESRGGFTCYTLVIGPDASRIDTERRTAPTVKDAVY